MTTRAQRLAAVRDLPKNEVRVAAVAGRVEVRDGDGDTVTIAGYAVVWDTPYFYGSATGSADDALFVEYCRKGMFAKTLAPAGDGSTGAGDQRLLLEHEGLPLARTTSGTLRLVEDNHGLAFEADLDPSDPDVQRLLPKLRRGDLSGMSFGFRVVRQAWNEDYTVRDLLEVALHEISVVTFPAYEATTVGLRSEDLAMVIADARAGKALSTGNAKLLKAAADALAELLSQCHEDDLADEDPTGDEGDEDLEDGTDETGDAGDAEPAGRSTTSLAQYKRELELAQLRRR